MGILRTAVRVRVVRAVYFCVWGLEFGGISAPQIPIYDALLSGALIFIASFADFSRILIKFVDFQQFG
jgi:hypothetical protein